MADEMETRARQAGQLGRLGLKLLDVVFAEVAESERVGVYDGAGREDLGDGEQKHFAARASRGVAGALDALLDGIEAGFEIFSGHSRGFYTARRRG